MTRTDHAARGRRLPGPLVLAASSAMISVGLVALSFAAGRRDEAPPAATGVDGLPARVDASTAERAAESFLDAWRKRSHAQAIELSVGAARDAAEARRDDDRALGGEDREMQKVWNALAAERLAFVPETTEEPEPGRVVLRGTAEGRFMGSPYRRRVTFETVRTEEGWRVAEMALGEQIAAPPELRGLVEDDG